MSDSSTARALVLESVVPPIVAVMEQEGFVFRRRGFCLVRQQSAVVQEVSLGPDFSPTYDPTALVVLHPILRVEYVDVAAALERSRPIGSGVAVLQPTNFGTDSGPKQWPIPRPELAQEVGESLAAHIANDVLPLLGALDDVSGFLAAHRRRDPRILWHRQATAAVIAALAQTGHRAEANAMAKDRFRGDSLRVEFPGVAALLWDG